MIKRYKGPVQVEDHRKEPCLGCQYEQNCLPCMAGGLSCMGRLPKACQNVCLKGIGSVQSEALAAEDVRF